VAIGKLGTVAIKPLEEALKETSPVVRVNVAHALGYIADPATIPSLMSLLSDTDEKVVKSASEALGKMGDKSLKPLMEQLSAGDDMARVGAINALSKMGKLSADALIKAMKDTNPKVRSSAALGLGQMGDKSVVPVLLDALDRDTDSAVKVSAAWALGELADGSVVSQMAVYRVRAAGKGDKALEEAIGKAIGRIEAPKK
jgi:HEAT repeat protein